MKIDPEAVLVHQVHSVKLAFDVSASVISNALLWRHRLGIGLASRYLLPVIGSALVLSFADLEPLRETGRGQYVLQHMPPASTALRLGGDTLMAVGAWRRKPSWIFAGVVLVAVGWSHGLFFEPISRPSPRWGEGILGDR